MTIKDGGPEKFIQAVIRGPGPDRWFVLELEDEGDQHWYELVAEAVSYLECERITRALLQHQEQGDD